MNKNFINIINEISTVGFLSFEIFNLKNLSIKLKKNYYYLFIIFKNQTINYKFYNTLANYNNKMLNYTFFSLMHDININFFFSNQNISLSSIFKGLSWLEREISEFNNLNLFFIIDSRKLLTNYNSISNNYINFNLLTSEYKIYVCTKKI